MLVPCHLPFVFGCEGRWCRCYVTADLHLNARAGAGHLPFALGREGGQCRCLLEVVVMVV